MSSERPEPQLKLADAMVRARKAMKGEACFYLNFNLIHKSGLPMNTPAYHHVESTRPRNSCIGEEL